MKHDLITQAGLLVALVGVLGTVLAAFLKRELHTRDEAIKEIKSLLDRAADKTDGAVEKAIEHTNDTARTIEQTRDKCFAAHKELLSRSEREIENLWAAVENLKDALPREYLTKLDFAADYAGIKQTVAMLFTRHENMVASINDLNVRLLAFLAKWS